MVLVWRITDDSPNFLPAKLFHYTVLYYLQYNIYLCVSFATPDDDDSATTTDDDDSATTPDDDDSGTTPDDDDSATTDDDSEVPK